MKSGPMGLVGVSPVEYPSVVEKLISLETKSGSP
jgi:hypothetical protein